MLGLAITVGAVVFAAAIAVRHGRYRILSGSVAFWVSGCLVGYLHGAGASWVPIDSVLWVFFGWYVCVLYCWATQTVALYLSEGWAKLCAACVLRNRRGWQGERSPARSNVGRARVGR